MPTFKNVSKKDGSRKWSVVFDLPTLDGVRKQKRLSGFNTRQEANLAYVAYLANYTPDAPDKPTGGTLGEAYCKYLEYMRSRVKESSYSVIESNYRNQIAPYLGERQLVEIKPIDIAGWHTELDKKGLSFETKKKTHGLLSRFFNYCVNYEILTANPCKKVERIKNTESKKEMLIWSESEFTQFILRVDDTVYKAFFSFLYLTGCRRGEALAITWKDISGNVVRINKTLGYHTINGGFVTTSPKNESSNRDILLPENLLALLTELKQYYGKIENFSDNNYVFGNTYPLPPETVRRKLKEYCEQAGVKVIRLHDFRHSHASLLISKGQDIVTIAKRLGHSDIEMTLNRYAHLMPNKQAELLSSLNFKLNP